jgi:hypothetical protein
LVGRTPLGLLKKDIGPNRAQHPRRIADIGAAPNTRNTRLCDIYTIDMHFAAMQERAAAWLVRARNSLQNRNNQRPSRLHHRHFIIAPAK